MSHLPASNTHRRSVFSAATWPQLFRRLTVCLLLVAWLLPMTTQAAMAQPAPLKVIVDTDPGVDDALALTWLLSQRERPVHVLGIVSVFGNTTVEYTTNNVLTVLEMNGRTDIPVIKGAAAPLAQAPTLTGWFIHGPDGLWGIGSQHPHDMSALPTDYAAFYCGAAAANPDATILTLGPLTNLANAAAACPDTLRTMRVVTLGGAKAGGNKNAVAEFNFWQDPEAVQRVLDVGIRLQIVPLDTFSRLPAGDNQLDKLLRKGNGAVQQLSFAISQYAAVQTQSGGPVLFPDVAATVFATELVSGSSRPALVKLTASQPANRGQSLVALSIPERLALIADDAELSSLAVQAFSVPNFDLNAAFGAILARQPDNALWIDGIDGKMLLNALERGLQ
ncbi:MAG: nucleoside hydrolase [Anaerolineae bacterium]|nr:nucleoside hydrolase [Anaerolineae bacterium]